MSKFTVIEGGGRGPEDPNTINARYHLRRLIIEILRSVSRGDDASRRITEELVQVTKHASSMSASLDEVVQAVIADTSTHAFPNASTRTDHYLNEMEDILRAKVHGRGLLR